jgi:hypothetical protein
MPIRINLLAEALAAEDLRRRDPVKRAGMAGLLLVLLSLAWFSSTWLGGKIEAQKLSQIDAQAGTYTNKFAQVQADARKIGDLQQRLVALDHFTAIRFLNGNLLNAVQQTYLPSVNLTRLHVDQSYTVIPGAPAKNNNPGRPPVNTEHVTVTLDARDSGVNPGEQVQPFKDALLAQTYFKTNIDPAAGIRLLNLSPVQTVGDSKPYVNFTLECRFSNRP